jgi:hypothetical protein
VCAGRVESQSLQPEEIVEGLLSQGVHRVEEFKYLEVFEELPQGVRAGVFFKTRVVEKAQEG